MKLSLIDINKILGIILVEVNMNKSFLVALAIIFGINFGASGQEDYIRYEQGADPQRDGELQIAVTEYVKKDAKTNKEVTVVLYGVVHVADQSYYDKVQKDLAACDTVLYEGIKQGTEPNKGTKGLNSVQKIMGDILGLTFQKDGINYNQKNFVHADVDVAELKESLKGESINPLEKFISPQMLEQLGPFLGLASEFLKMYMESQPGLQDNLKMQMAQQLSSGDAAAQLPPNMKKAILDDRNQIVEDILAKRLITHPQDKRIIIFYGAAHHPDFEKRLEKRGFAKAKTKWMTAWKIGNGAGL